MPSLLDRFKSGNALTDAASVSTPEDNALHAAILQGGYRPRQSLSVMDTYKPQVPAYAAEEPGLAGGIPTEGVTGLELSPLDLVGTGALTKAAALAKAFGVPLAAALGATGIASRASKGARLSELARSMPSQRGIFAGVGAKTANREALAKAEQLKSAGVPDEQIWKETGWTFGFPDQKPRFEIPDNAAQLRLMPRANQMLKAQTVDDFISHPELLAAHPDLAQTDIRLSRSTSGGKGAYLPDLNTIELAGLSDTAPYSMSNDIKSTTLHELQHAIQQREGFARGGSPEQMVQKDTKQQSDIVSDALGLKTWGEEKFKVLNGREPDKAAIALARYNDKGTLETKLNNLKYSMLHPEDQYQRLAGEAESRLAQARMNMTPEERAASYPPSMFDVPSEQQIVRYGEGRAMSVPEKPFKFGGKDFYKTESGMKYKGDFPISEEEYQLAKNKVASGDAGGGLDYQIAHKPMTIEGGASPLHDLTTSFGDEIYGRNALEYYGSGDTREKSTLRIMQSLKDKPNAMVTIYRGAPSEAKGINPGDWVTLDKSVAQDYVNQALENEGKKGKVFSQKVPASHITSWPDSLLEFGYHPPTKKSTAEQYAELLKNSQDVLKGNQ